MTASSADTAELPRVRGLALAAPVTESPVTGAPVTESPVTGPLATGSLTGSPPVPRRVGEPLVTRSAPAALRLTGPAGPAGGASGICRDRAGLRAERRRAQRQRRLLAVLGLSVMFLMLAVTVAVLDVMH